MIFPAKTGLAFKYDDGCRNIEERSGSRTFNLRPKRLANRGPIKEMPVPFPRAAIAALLQTRRQPRANAVFKRLIWSETGLARRLGACVSLTTPP
ncbi:hypothetical protein MJ8_59920 [Mesorhizobium sp. J8]|nr:hypothetical protein MJ8_59920 [Mesorhizobium sp. J8]